MQTEIKLDEDRKEPKIIVVTDKMTDEINGIVKRLSDKQPKMIAGLKDDIVEVLEPFDTHRILAASGRAFAETNHGEYTLRLWLHEIEQRLDSNFFVRTSNSDIINPRKVKGFDLSFAGTTYVTPSNGTVTYVPRRSVAKIKQSLGIRGGKNEKKDGPAWTPRIPSRHCYRFRNNCDYINMHRKWFVLSCHP